MNDDVILQRLRRFLLAVAAAIFAGTAFELVLVGHYEETLQWVPFIVSALGLAAVGAVWFTPGARAIRVLRGVMGLAVLASLVGVGAHFYSNFTFVREINPSFTLTQSIWPALKGSHPLLAPGILLLGGVLGIAATYRHPKSV